MPYRCVLFVTLCFPALHWLIALPSARAGSGGEIALPPLGFKNKSGLKLKIDGRGVDGNGYRPLRIEVTPWPPVPLTADRQIRVVLKPRTYNTMSTPDVSQVIELPEGSTSVQATFLVPQGSLWYNLGVETYEGGEKLRDLSHDYLGWPNTTGYWEWTEARPTMLFIDSDVPPRAIREPAVQTYKTTAADPTPTTNLPDVRQLIWLFPDPNRNPGTTAPPVTLAAGAPAATDLIVLTQIHDQPRCAMLPPEELPRRWIEISQFDLVVLSYADLKLLNDQHPPEIAALRDWLATGPLLIVYGVGEEFQELAGVEKLLELPALPEEGSSLRGWTKPSDRENTDSLKDRWYSDNSFQFMRSRYRNIRPPRNRAAQATVLDDELTGQAAKPATEGTAGKRPPFVFRPAGQGVVVAIASENPFPGKEEDWIWIFNSVEDHHWRWFQRNGFSLHRENDDYWTFLIPGVGQAPVFSFLLLVSLFAVAIGPINYLLLGRVQRLYLLLLTVPAGAALITVSLFAYALVTDGLSVRLRVRSFTELDQRTGRATAWSRQSYYASIAPSQGLVFPEDTTVFPIVYEPARTRRTTNENDRLLIWDGDQSLRSGYLASRTTTQFMVQRATHSEARLVVREGVQAGQPPTVENRLATPIEYLLLRDSRGAYFASERLAADGAATLTPTDPAAAEAALVKLAEAVKPAFPSDKWTPDSHNNALGFLRTPMGGWMGVDTSSSQPLMAASLLESNIAAAVHPTLQPLLPGTYVAIVLRSPVVPIGVPQAREEASFHVIRGRYKP